MCLEEVVAECVEDEAEVAGVPEAAWRLGAMRGGGLNENIQ